MSKEKLSAEALNDLEKIIEWLNGLGPKWNLFGDIDRAKKQAQNVKKKLEHLQREREEAVNLLSSVECPNCDGSGIMVVETTRVGYGPADEYGSPTPMPVQELEPTPCEWCAIRDSFLTPKPEK